MKKFPSLIISALIFALSGSSFFQSSEGFSIQPAAKTKMPSLRNLNAEHLMRSSHQTNSRPQTALYVTTKEPPIPPGNGKSVLDLIALPLIVASAIPVVLLMMQSVESTVSVASTASDNVGAGTVLMQTTLAQNP